MAFEAEGHGFQTIVGTLGFFKIHVQNYPWELRPKSGKGVLSMITIEIVPKLLCILHNNFCILNKFPTYVQKSIFYFGYPLQSWPSSLEGTSRAWSP